MVSLQRIRNFIYGHSKRVLSSWPGPFGPLFHGFFSTAIALGSSAMVKVSGQNCFRTLYGSLGQIRLGLRKGSVTVSERFLQGCASLVVSLVFWGRSSAKGSVLKGAVEGSPRFHQGCASFVISLVFCAKRFCGKFPHHFLKFVPQFLNSFLHFSPTALALGSSAIVKVLGQNDTFAFLSFLKQMAFASQKVLWSVPQTVLYIDLRVSCGFSGKWLLLHKKFFGGFRQLCFTFLSQSPPGVNVA